MVMHRYISYARVSWQWLRRPDVAVWHIWPMTDRHSAAITNSMQHKFCIAEVILCHFNRRKDEKNYRLDVCQQLAYLLNEIPLLSSSATASEDLLPENVNKQASTCCMFVIGFCTRGKKRMTGQKFSLSKTFQNSDGNLRFHFTLKLGKECSCNR